MRWREGLVLIGVSKRSSLADSRKFEGFGCVWLFISVDFFDEFLGHVLELGGAGECLLADLF